MGACVSQVVQICVFKIDKAQDKMPVRNKPGVNKQPLGN